VLLAPEAMAGWQKKLASISYSRPEEVSGLAALKTISEWMHSTIRIDTDSRGFWMLYELLTGTLNVKILLDDNPYCTSCADPTHDGRPLLLPRCLAAGCCSCTGADAMACLYVRTTHGRPRRAAPPLIGQRSRRRAATDPATDGRVQAARSRDAQVRGHAQKGRSL
jgi:hypothetical protein